MVKLLFLLIFLTVDTQAKTIVLGFDGMDPKLVQQWMDSGDLPHFKKLAQTGSFQPLATSNPAQSPVAWSSFATGLNPGQHGIFDFIHRDPKTFQPVYSISGIKQAETLDIFGWQIPTSEPNIYNKRLGKPFWLTAEQQGNHSSILRVPVTYPPDNVTSMLSGMGVPDLLGTQGTYSYYATKFIDKNKNGGNITRIKVKNDQVKTTLVGPPNPFGSELLSVPLVLSKAKNNTMQLNLNGEIRQLQTATWSNWIPVQFSYGGVFSLDGMVRVFLQESFPRIKLYVSPININPQSAILPIANPPEFAKQLSDDIGLYHTLGMPEETWSLNDGLINSKTYLEMVETILAEREKMFFRQLADDSIQLLVEVFVQTDRVSHMFWRGYDNNHPNHENTSAIERNAIKWIYQQADRILGKTLNKLQANDKLIVLSDHGFSPYYRHVNLNRWLLQQGYLKLKSNKDDFSLKDVDWSATKAYAMGLNGIYINQKDRELYGIIDANDADRLSLEIASKLQLLKDSEQAVINQVYQRDEVYSGAQSHNSPDLIIGYKRGFRASWQTVLGEAPKALFETNTDNWSGDHCIDPQLVPGVLFTNFKINKQALNIANIGSITLSTLDNNPIKPTKQRGLLDIPRSVLLKIISPIQKFIPAIIAEIITGMLLILCLWIISKLTNAITAQFILRFISKSIIMLITAIVFFDVAKSQYSNDFISDNDEIIIQAQPIANIVLPQLTWQKNGKTTVIQPLEKNKWQLKLPMTDMMLVESDGYKLLNINSHQPISSSTQKNWWHSLLSNKGGYLSPYSQVQKVSVKAVNGSQYWWIWLLTGIFIAMIFNYHRHKKTS